MGIILALAMYAGYQDAGMNKICYYKYLGSTYTLVIGSTQLCPLSIEVN